MLRSLLLLVTTGLAQPPGAVLPGAPAVAPGRAAPPPPDSLTRAIEARQQGDLVRAAWLYESWLGGKRGDGGLRAAVQLALGLVYLDLDEPSLASASFSRVRASGAPAAPWGAWYEALADHTRGRHTAASAGCQAYRKRWPTGPHADECLVLIGDASVAARQRGSAVAAYQAYLDAHPDSPRDEPLRLGIALAVSTTEPTRAIPLLQGLVLSHQYHSTGDTAQHRLDELAAEGHATALPTDGITACRIAAERKRCGYESDAWARFQELELKAADDPAIASWIDANADQFRWGTSQYLDLAATLEKRYATKPSAELAWQRYRALARGGDWAGAEAVLEAGSTTHGGRLRNRELLGRAQLLSGNYTGARGSFDTLAKSGGALGREARWLAAFAAFRAGDDADALKRLDALQSNDDWTGEAARYYRVRTLDRLGRTEEAATGRAAILSSDPWSWYAALLRNEEPTAPGEVARQGRWPGPRPPELAVPKHPATASPALAINAGGFRSERERPSIDWTLLGSAASSSPSTATVAEVALASTRAWNTRPEAYAPGPLLDPVSGASLLTSLGKNHPETFPDALAAVDLARAGLFDLAAPLVARMYDAIDPAVGGVAHPEITLSVAEWRQVFLLVRDHYHVARFSWGLHKGATTDEARRAAWRLTYPTAEADALWKHGERYDVDPLMALGLMRQESVYRQWALSPVGAIGLMQVMPRTGARIAARMGDKTYSPDQLEDPSVNVRYGVWYLSMLLDRFGGAWPLAVASYNGGPHNVSSWLRPFGDRIRMDDFVESMPYTETRDYVKKVTGYYMAYTQLYGAPPDQVRIPMQITKDDPEVVNF